MFHERRNAFPTDKYRCKGHKLCVSEMYSPWQKRPSDSSEPGSDLWSKDKALFLTLHHHTLINSRREVCVQGLRVNRMAPPDRGLRDLSPYPRYPPPSPPLTRRLDQVFLTNSSSFRAQHEHKHIKDAKSKPYYPSDLRTSVFVRVFLVAKVLPQILQLRFSSFSCHLQRKPRFDNPTILPPFPRSSVYFLHDHTSSCSAATGRWEKMRSISCRIIWWNIFDAHQLTTNCAVRNATNYCLTRDLTARNQVKHKGREIYICLQLRLVLWTLVSFVQESGPDEHVSSTDKAWRRTLRLRWSQLLWQRAFFLNWLNPRTDGAQTQVVRRHINIHNLWKTNEPSWDVVVSFVGRRESTLYGDCLRQGGSQQLDSTWLFENKSPILDQDSAAKKSSVSQQI